MLVFRNQIHLTRIRPSIHLPPNDRESLIQRGSPHLFLFLAPPIFIFYVSAVLLLALTLSIFSPGYPIGSLTIHHISAYGNHDEGGRIFLLIINFFSPSSLTKRNVSTAFKTSRWEVPGSVKGRACRLSRSKFSRFFLEN